MLESRTGPFTFDDRPWWKFPLRCLASRKCVSVAMPASTQIGKTANLDIASLLYFAEFRPAPGMVILPDEKEAKLFRDRVYAVVEESQKFGRFNRIHIPPVSRWNVQEISLGSMICHLAWAGSKQRTRGKPCWYVWFVECDVYPDADRKAGDPIEAGKQRTKDVYSYKHIFESSPRPAPSAIRDEESAAEVRFRWYGECPHCGTWQEVRFFPERSGEQAGRGGIANIKTPDGEYLSPDEAAKAATYICRTGCKIGDEYKARFVESGRWAPLN
jgi:phage terminase large subunit GpA-like protein